MIRHPHAEPAEQVADTLGASEAGLSSAEAAERLREHGPNTLPRARTSPLAFVGHQLQSVFVWILMAALVLSIVLPIVEATHQLSATDFIDAFVIGGILVLNTLLGAVQEARAERSIAVLAKMSAPRALVLRDGAAHHVASRDMVPGDRVLLEAGDRVPADLRLLSATSLQVDESALTGESSPVDKGIEPVAEGADLGDRSSMAWSGTLVTHGSGVGIVTHTGTHTEVGRLAGLLQASKAPPTPLEGQLQRLARALALVALVSVVLVAGVGALQQLPLGELLLVSVSLGVSMVPEGLPAVVTVCFAVAARRMVEHGALVRRLDALETLGSVTVLCSDKTGTLTENRMTVVETWGDDEALLAEIGISCNHAADATHGDPTELALLRFAEEHGARRRPIDDEPVPFSSEIKYMTTRHGADLYTKGAPERVASLAGSPPEVLAAADDMARRGRRVLAAARATGEGPLEVVGLFGLEDPPRAGAPEAVAVAARAGVRTVMITGDHAGTAAAIAARVGLPVDEVTTGAQIDGLDDAALQARVQSCSVFARVSPEHKVRLCRALQAGGEVVSMTGDGVNDAPALKAAHVGVAMGGRGTDVAREAASIVLADDHYATLVAAIAEGRRSHDNIRRFVLFLLRANFDELLLVLAAFALGLPVPYLPVHILWINLLTDGLPALALTAEPGEADLMDRPPRPPKEHLLEREWFGLAVATLLGFAGAFAVYVGVLWQYDDLPLARSAALSFAVVLELLMAFSARSALPAWRVKWASNPYLLAACGGVLALHLLLLYTPLGVLLHLLPIGLELWAGILALALAIFFGFEATKKA